MDLAYRDLNGKHALVTGGSSGIGAAIVEAFRLQQVRVSILDLVAPSNDSPKDLRETGIAFEQCDLRDPAQVESCITALHKRSGPVDILVNNAARDDRHSLSEADTTLWDDLMAINLRAAFLVSRSVVPGIADQGVIINISSNAFLLGLDGYPAYVTAKAGLWGLTKALARELGPRGIRVNCLVPGWVKTERQGRLWMTPESLEACLQAQCLKRVIETDDIANACLFLASTASRMMTGQMLVVDGGRT